MSVEEKRSYIRKLEYDTDLDPEAIDAEICANIDAEDDPAELGEWAEVLWDRCANMRDINAVYEEAAEKAEHQAAWLMD